MVPKIPDICKLPNEVTTPRCQSRAHLRCVWASPYLGFIKVKVDESFLVGSDKGEIEGILCDYKRRIPLQFAKEVNCGVFTYSY